MSGTIRSFVHFCKVRCGVETQLEHRMIADSVKDILKENLPFVHEAAFSEP
jgi:thymidylate synthase (FAD)